MSFKESLGIEVEKIDNPVTKEGGTGNDQMCTGKGQDVTWWEWKEMR